MNLLGYINSLQPNELDIYIICKNYSTVAHNMYVAVSDQTKCYNISDFKSFHILRYFFDNFVWIIKEHNQNYNTL